MATPSPHVSRMLIERYELYEKELRLGEFIIDNPTFKTLAAQDQDLMQQQLEAMTKYRTILEQRIARASE